MYQPRINRFQSNQIKVLLIALLAFFALAIPSSAIARGAENGVSPTPEGASPTPEHASHTPEGAPIINWTDLGYSDKDIHGGSLDKGETPMAPPLLFALFNFFVFAGLLYWKAGPAISKYLANRHDTIKNALEEAAKLQAQAKEKMEEYSRRIEDADEEVNAMISQIRKDAEEEKDRLIKEAERQATQMKKDADARIESDIALAKRELEREVVAKAVEVAEKLLNQKSSDVDHNTLFASFIDDLKEQKNIQTRGQV